MKKFFSKIKSKIEKVIISIKKTFANLKDKIKNIFNRNKNIENEEIDEINNEPIISNENTNSIPKENQTIIRTSTIPMNRFPKYRTTGNYTPFNPIVLNKTQNNNIPNSERNNAINLDSIPNSEEVYDTINNENTERINSIVIKESMGIVEFETISGKKYQKNIEDILSERKELYKDWNIKKKCKDLTKNKIQALMLRRKLNPVVVDTLNNEEDIDNYIKCINNTEKIWFNLEHDLINSKLKGKNARLMKRVGKYEEKIGIKVKRNEGLIERILKKIKADNKEPEEEKTLHESDNVLTDEASNFTDKLKQQLINDKTNSEVVESKTQPIFTKAKIEDKVTPQNTLKGEIPTQTNNNNMIEKTKKSITKEKAEKDKEKTKKENEPKDELIEFDKRYKDYNILAKGILGVQAKKDIQEIRSDVLHNDIYNMTSADDVTKGIATFRVGHRLALLPEKKKEAERLLKTATSILNNDDVLSKDDSLIGVLQNAHMDLGNFYLMNDDFVNAQKSFQDYMKTVKKEKVEKYDPKILEAKKNGKVIDEIDLWIEIKSKFAAGEKSMIKLLSKSGKTEEAEERYKKLLEDCKISLSDEEYQLSVDTNCVENGRYMRITNDRTYCEPILGNEYLLLKRRNITNKALSER